MREIKLNGYIDDEIWFGDEMTPDTVFEALHGEKGDLKDDVHITINSYGGSVTAAARIHDIMKDYPGKVHVTVSGTAASAAVGLVMAADNLDMTPGSMMMIHDPITVAYGNAQNMAGAIEMLNTAKNSILNLYETRVKTERAAVSQMMTDETWMDAKAALEHGFIDAIHQSGDVKNSAQERVYDRAEAKEKIEAFYNRRIAAMTPKARAEPEAKPENKVNARTKRLSLMMLK